jgi:hypothetical protein
MATLCRSLVFRRLLSVLALVALLVPGTTVALSASAQS